ncbi:hypothetical protein [Blastopirellula marina]|uniref:Uncharacterized protein n=1 Tax=Blastopirellula marina DSM 3645 TaxID=314230 RepID=A3ZZ78_9BACT|nr:hypothetical protein [Blastopirellula marina]EAQ78191.1 hypothetical protein DSM3645_15480 [Blastopirellula marina DSM 3645]
MNLRIALGDVNGAKGKSQNVPLRCEQQGDQHDGNQEMPSR